MHSVLFPALIKPLFKRRSLDLEPQANGLIETKAKNSDRNDSPALVSVTDECTALVINSSHQMAKEITFALTLRMPNCSIMYAPSVQLARWILVRRKVDLIVSNSILPDGCVTGLLSDITNLKSPPDLVVVGEVSVKATERLNQSGYQFTSLRHIGEIAKALPVNEEQPTVKTKVKELGKDLRNDLNNPLQEIVAMVFVAQNGGTASSATVQALEAIDRAAKNMATKIRGLEERIEKAVS